MNAIGEQALRWFSAERVIAEPDLTALVRDYSGLLYRVALSVLHNPAEAEDVVQDAFVRVLQRQHELAAILDLRPWLVRIAWNLALDRTRRARPNQMDDLFAASLVAADLPADQALAEARQIKQVLRAMERLPKQERQALLLSAMDELSTVEIGAVLGRSESSVRSLLFRARAHLRQRLEGC
jgi:RNA polymerase sigma-70 factor (ECF subfamily)